MRRSDNDSPNVGVDVAVDDAVGVEVAAGADVAVAVAVAIAADVGVFVGATVAVGAAPVGVPLDRFSSSSSQAQTRRRAKSHHRFMSPPLGKQSTRPSPRRFARTTGRRARAHRF